MLGYVAGVVRRRAPAVPRLGWLALLSFVAGAAVTLGVLFGLGVFPLSGRTVVPITGLMIGNSMTATVLGARRLAEELTRISTQLVRRNMSAGRVRPTTHVTS